MKQCKLYFQTSLVYLKCVPKPLLLYYVNEMLEIEMYKTLATAILLKKLNYA